MRENLLSQHAFECAELNMQLHRARLKSGTEKREREYRKPEHAPPLRRLRLGQRTGDEFREIVLQLSAGIAVDIQHVTRL